MWKVGYQFRRHLERINAVDIDETEIKLATASNDNCVGVLDLNTQEMRFLQGHSDYVEDVAFGKDMSILASASRDQTCILWNTKLNEKISVLKGHKKTVRCLSWSPDHKYLVTGSNDQTAYIWDVEECLRTKRILGIKGWIRDIEWKNDTIAYAGNDKYIYLYDVRSGQNVQMLETNSSSDMTSISFHHSGAMIAGCGFDQHVRIWDLKTCSTVWKQMVHSEVVTHVSFSPKSDDFLTVGMDGIARIWNMKCTDSISSFHQHDEGISSCCWYKSAKGFVTVGVDKKIVGFEYREKKHYHPMADGGDIMVSIGRMQNAMEQLVNTMKRLDDRIMVQEERIRWLKDNDKFITRAYERRKPDETSF
ncbi:hypothetical protein TRFO_32928 [Tritrichomonas foetus]|uniref:Uncharacterized protein n=1 Tax=Tritrichomonas foetus TaxID=1144522 RepID=A0A1J4JMS9_9EUKA|nr:hypothetical protein TRFO_32928 [Tritrichomonas foetus]|eukprot:OHT00423.1 hypothetical protein TRFO_32928 [Tritrichomonas foetus]